MGQSETEPHRVLGVSPSASARQVRKAYKRLARKYHPDRDPSPGAAKRFMAIKAAHDAMLTRIERGEPATAKRPDPAPPPPRPRPSGPAAPPPRRPPPQNQGHPWVTYGNDPDEDRFEFRPPPSADLWERAFQHATRPTVQDLWRPMLYTAAAVVWLFLFAFTLSVLGSIDRWNAANQPAEPTKKEQRDEPRRERR